MDDFLLGNHWVTDGKTGKKIRASDARTEWNGTITHKDHYEQRHPQDFVRVRPETARVKDPRPPAVVVYKGPLKTLLGADHAAGVSSITVESSARMEAGDRVEVLLNNGDVHRTVIQSITDATTIVLLVALPWAVSTGNVLTNYTAIALSNIE